MFQEQRQMLKAKFYYEIVEIEDVKTPWLHLYDKKEDEILQFQSRAPFQGDLEASLREAVELINRNRHVPMDILIEATELKEGKIIEYTRVATPL